MDDLFSGSSEKIKIKLNPNLSASQNAQWFYRQFSKSRSRQKAAKLALDEAARKRGLVETQMKQLEKAQTNDELRALRELIIGRKPARCDATAATAKQRTSRREEKRASRACSA